MRNRTVVGLAFLAAASIQSCGDFASRWAILDGNIHYQRAEYDAAIDAYSGAAANRTTAPYASYGLGLAFDALGETSGALERYLEAAETGIGGLRSAAYYNAGLAEFRREAYAVAAAYFRRALEAVPDEGGYRDNVAQVRWNLELSLKLAETATEAADKAPSGAGPSDGKTETASGKAAGNTASISASEAGSANRWLFDYVEQEETKRWRSREWIGDGSSGPDY